MEESNDIDVETVNNENIPETTIESPTEINQSNNGLTSSTEKQKFVKLPLARIKNMMKMDPDCSLISQDALILITKATEMFVDLLAKESFKQTALVKRKTMLKRDVDCAIACVPHLCFLDGALE